MQTLKAFTPSGRRCPLITVNPQKQISDPHSLSPYSIQEQVLPQNRACRKLSVDFQKTHQNIINPTIQIQEIPPQQKQRIFRQTPCISLYTVPESFRNSYDSSSWIHSQNDHCSTGYSPSNGSCQQLMFQKNQISHYPSGHDQQISPSTPLVYRLQQQENSSINSNKKKFDQQSPSFVNSFHVVPLKQFGDSTSSQKNNNKSCDINLTSKDTPTSAILVNKNFAICTSQFEQGLNQYNGYQVRQNSAPKTHNSFSGNAACFQESPSSSIQTNQITQNGFCQGPPQLHDYSNQNLITQNKNNHGQQMIKNPPLLIQQTSVKSLNFQKTKGQQYNSFEMQNQKENDLEKQNFYQLQNSIPQSYYQGGGAPSIETSLSRNSHSPLNRQTFIHQLKPPKEPLKSQAPLVKILHPIDKLQIPSTPSQLGQNNQMITKKITKIEKGEPLSKEQNQKQISQEQENILESTKQQWSRPQIKSYSQTLHTQKCEGIESSSQPMRDQTLFTLNTLNTQNQQLKYQHEMSKEMNSENNLENEDESSKQNMVTTLKNGTNQKMRQSFKANDQPSYTLENHEISQKQEHQEQQAQHLQEDSNESNTQEYINRMCRKEYLEETFQNEFEDISSSQEAPKVPIAVESTFNYSDLLQISLSEIEAQNSQALSNFPCEPSVKEEGIQVLKQEQKKKFLEDLSNQANKIKQQKEDLFAFNTFGTQNESTQLNQVDRTNQGERSNEGERVSQRQSGKFNKQKDIFEKEKSQQCRSMQYEQEFNHEYIEQQQIQNPKIQNMNEKLFGHMETRTKKEVNQISLEKNSKQEIEIDNDEQQVTSEFEEEYADALYQQLKIERSLLQIQTSLSRRLSEIQLLLPPHNEEDIQSYSSRLNTLIALKLSTQQIQMIFSPQDKNKLNCQEILEVLLGTQNIKMASGSSEMTEETKKIARNVLKEAKRAELNLLEIREKNKRGCQIFSQIAGSKQYINCRDLKIFFLKNGFEVRDQEMMLLIQRFHKQSTIRLYRQNFES